MKNKSTCPLCQVEKIKKKSAEDLKLLVNSVYTSNTNMGLKINIGKTEERVISPGDKQEGYGHRHHHQWH